MGKIGQKIDDFISVFAPGFALKRLSNRIYYDEMRGYEAASTGRLHDDWHMVSGTAEQTDRGSRDILRGRARQLELNSDMAEGIVGAITRNVIGTGIKPQARVKMPNGDMDEVTNKILEDAWQKWRTPANCDISEQQSFEELEEMICRRFLIDGEVFAHFVIDPEREFPLQIQMIEPERVQSFDQYSADGNQIVAGIEMTKQYRPINYWITEQDPLGFTSYQATPYPASSMMHIWRRQRPTQVRGVTILARVMNKIHQVDSYMNADLIAARAAASYAAFVTTNHKPRNTKQESKEVKLEPGTVQYLEPGESVTFGEPNRNASGVSEYVKTMGRKIATGVDVSYDLISRDITGNFSAARQNMLEDRKSFEPLQQFFIEKFCQKVWEKFVEICYLKGILMAPDYLTNPDKYTAVRWQTPGWSWIDPTKEVTAQKESIKAGFTTLADVCASQGADWEEVLEQQAMERRKAESLGLPLDVFNAQTSQQTGGNNEQTNENGDEDGPEDENP